MNKEIEVFHGHATDNLYVLVGTKMVVLSSIGDYYLLDDVDIKQLESAGEVLSECPLKKVEFNTWVKGDRTDND